MSDGEAAETWSLPPIDPADTPEKRAAAHEAERRRQYAHAREQGLADARAAAAAELRPQLAALGELLQQLAEPLAELDDEVEAALVDLACRIARQVVRRELQTDRAQILVVAREALAALPLNARGITVALHPKDAELVRESLASVDGGAKWTITEDPLLTRGGLRVQSERSLVDATVEKRLQNVVETLISDERAADRMPEAP